MINYLGKGRVIWIRVWFQVNLRWKLRKRRKIRRGKIMSSSWVIEAMWARKWSRVIWSRFLSVRKMTPILRLACIRLSQGLVSKLARLGKIRLGIFRRRSIVVESKRRRFKIWCRLIWRILIRLLRSRKIRLKGVLISWTGGKIREIKGKGRETVGKIWWKKKNWF